MLENPDLNIERLRHLLSEHFNESIDQQGRAELDHLLSSFPAARAIFWQYVEVHAGLHFRYRATPYVDFDGPDTIISMGRMQELPQREVQKKLPARFRPLAPFALAAAVLLIALGAILTNPVLFNKHREETATDRIANRDNFNLESQDRDSVLGSIRPLVESSRWSFGKPGESNRNSFMAGDTLWLESGAVELQLSNKTSATLEAPVIMQMLSLDRARVLKGRITVDVAKGAEGFTVETSSAEVVDLGTVFSVDVNDIATDVIVFQGKVDLKYSKQLGTEKSSLPRPSDLEVRRMNMGEAIRIRQDGTLSRIAQVRQTDFGRQLKPIIISVRDNVHRVDMLNFYEIVPQGMQEDVQSFADRLHQWNGVDGRGMPSYLIGGDYVRTFNDDKVVDELEITLTVDQPAMVYVLMDTRTPPPPWLIASFEKTGDVIGVDQKSVAPFEGAEETKYHLATGAGNSVDFIHSIWRREIREPGEVVLGPNGLLLEQTKEAGISAGVNMYGIVVVPLGENSR